MEIREGTTRIINADALQALQQLENESVDCIVTSPPYFRLRDYGINGQIGLEGSVEEYIGKLVTVFDECRRILKKQGTLWLNIGDTYACSGRGGNRGEFNNNHSARVGSIVESKRKNLLGVPWRLAFALQGCSWNLRQDIIWHKSNPMPESVKDRCVKSHEYIFLFSKSAKYFFDYKAIQEPSIWKALEAPGGWVTDRGEAHDSISHNSVIKHRKAKPKGSFNGKHGSAAFRSTGEWRRKRSVWSVGASPFKGAHFATFPPNLIRPCIKAGCPSGGTVLDPFAGSGTTGIVATEEGRESILIELNPIYVELMRKRLQEVA